MAKTYYVINKRRACVESERGTRAEAEGHIRNSTELFGGSADDYVIAEGAKDRENILKGLKETAPYRR